MFNCSRAGATTQSRTRLTRRSHEDSQPIFFYLMCHFGKQSGPASREHPGNRQSHMPEIADHAALRNGGPFAAPLMRPVLASSRSSPQIRDTSTYTNTPKPVRILRMNSMTTTLKPQLSKSDAVNMAAPPLEGEVAFDRA